jgi:hypothetical protein
MTRHERIAVRAYFLWKKFGRSALDNWLLAEFLEEKWLENIK